METISHASLVSQDRNSEERFHIELHFSPGAYNVQMTDKSNAPAANMRRGYQPNFIFANKEANGVKGNLHPPEAVSRVSNVECVGSLCLLPLLD